MYTCHPYLNDALCLVFSLLSLLFLNREYTKDSPRKVFEEQHCLRQNVSPGNTFLENLVFWNEKEVHGCGFEPTTAAPTVMYRSPYTIFFFVYFVNSTKSRKVVFTFLYVY